MRLLLALALLAACEPATSPARVPPAAVDEDGDGYAALADGGTDCDDAVAAISPEAIEACNGLDDDCDGAVDETFDQDGDGALFDDPGCRALGAPLDCDDSDPGRSPTAVETCDGRDEDCDDRVDELPDADGDGVGACEDCDDADAARSPNEAERCDGLDNNCDGRADEPWDLDGDGFAPCAGDCDDGDPEAFPGAPELCDGVDNSCDGTVDEGFDADGDGFSTCRGDCDDTQATVNPWAEEVCDGLDNDCDGAADGDDLDDGDEDGDGYGRCGVDCDDEDADIFPGASEVCEGLDTDCDGLIPADESDADADGERPCDGDCDDADPAIAAAFPEACDGLDNDCDPATLESVDHDGDGASACEGDCDDRDPAIALGGVEICDAKDNDCDGTVDEMACAPCTRSTYGDHSYLFCPNRLVWTDARDFCLARGRDLLAITDNLEESWLSAEIDTRLGAGPWMGLNDLTTEGDFVWSNGEPADYLNWASGEPNDSGGEDCAQARWSGDAWNDAVCGYANTFVCESLD
jgi:hypothetical protein